MQPVRGCRHCRALPRGRIRPRPSCTASPTTSGASHATLQVLPKYPVDVHGCPYTFPPPPPPRPRTTVSVPDCRLLLFVGSRPHHWWLGRATRRGIRLEEPDVSDTGTHRRARRHPQPVADSYSNLRALALRAAERSLLPFHPVTQYHDPGDEDARIRYSCGMLALEGPRLCV